MRTSAVDHKSQPRSTSWFQDQYKKGSLELRPPFQRKPVWTEKQKSALIESILMNVPIPEVYIQVQQDEDGTEEYGVVDGQQRLRTILQFIGLESEEDQEGDEDYNNFALDALPPTSPYLGKTFADVTGDARKKFYQYEICVRFLYTDDIRQIEDVFKRLNKFLMPLKAQELRNATYHGAFAKLSEELANDEYWAVNRIVSPAAIRRMADIEMMSDLLIGLLHGPQGGSARIIDQYYEQYEPYDDEFPGQAKIKTVFDNTRSLIEHLFPKISDIRWGNRADHYSLFVAIGEQLKTKELRKRGPLRKKLLEFADEVDKRLERPTVSTSKAARAYARAIEKGVNDKARRSDRHEVLTALIAPFFHES
jgi:hypothetical protein